MLRYFPDALLEVAYCSWVGNEQHNPGTPLHWDRSKSTDEADACARHLMESGTRDTDGVRHAAKAAWRALANLQKEIEAEREALVEKKELTLKDLIGSYKPLQPVYRDGGIIGGLEGAIPMPYRWEPPK